MKKEIKKIFQDSFEGFDSPVDTQGLLSGIAAKLIFSLPQQRLVLT